MGFNAKDGGAHEYNYYKSNTAGILNLDSEPSNTGEHIWCSVTGYLMEVSQTYLCFNE